MSPNLFIGKEAEGPNQGKQTLFVANVIGGPSFEKIIDTISQHSIECIYFGAGNCRGISSSLLSNLFKLPRTLLVTVECNKVEQIAKFEPYFKSAVSYFTAFHVVFVIDVENLNFFQNVTDIKLIDNQKLIWIPIQRSYTTQLDDAEYSRDWEIKV